MKSTMGNAYRRSRVCAVAFQLLYRARTGGEALEANPAVWRFLHILTKCKRLAIIIPIQVPRKK